MSISLTAILVATVATFAEMLAENLVYVSREIHDWILAWHHIEAQQTLVTCLEFQYHRLLHHFLVYPFLYDLLGFLLFSFFYLLFSTSYFFFSICFFFVFFFLLFEKTITTQSKGHQCLFGSNFFTLLLKWWVFYFLMLNSCLWWAK